MKDNVKICYRQVYNHYDPSILYELTTQLSDSVAMSDLDISFACSIYKYQKF